MTDLIWIGNTLYPRWVVFAAIGVVLLIGFGIVALVTKVAQKLICKRFGVRQMNERRTPDHLADLVSRFSEALLEKLRAAEQKYGRKDDWLEPNWEADCQRQLLEHVAKGDPRDVAAYAAFCWHHSWPTYPLASPEKP